MPQVMIWMGLVNYPRNVEGVEVGMLFKEKAAGVIKVSLRSSGLVDVAAIAQSLGGGGHVRASGCTIQGTLEEAVAKMVQEVGNKLHMTLEGILPVWKPAGFTSHDVVAKVRGILGYQTNWSYGNT